MVISNKIFSIALEKLKNNYTKFLFFTERDIEWTLQLLMISELKEKNSPLKIYNNFSLKNSSNNKVKIDLITVDDENLELALEIKYEPDHRRCLKPYLEIRPEKLNPSVVFWSTKSKDTSVEKDIKKIKDLVNSKLCKTGISLFFDEGRLFRNRNCFEDSYWVDWEFNDKRIPSISILAAKFGVLEDFNI